MDWLQFTILIMTFMGVFLWTRSESNADRREIMNLIQAIKDEMKDFHARLCVIEDRNKK